MSARRKGYGQFCPVAKAAEVVAERWTPLVLRELLSGSRRFNELRRGVPLMSPSLLSRRLAELEDSGVIRRTAGGKGVPSQYLLTEAGEELRPIIEGLGAWGHRWVQHEVQPDDLDPSLLMWDVRRWADPRVLPEDRRTVVAFEFSEVASKHRSWWLIFERGEVDLCMKDPGHEVDLWVRSSIRGLTEVWLGLTALTRAIRDDRVELTGRRNLVRSFPKWFRLSPFAQVERPRSDRLGRQNPERDLELPNRDPDATRRGSAGEV